MSHALFNCHVRGCAIGEDRVGRSTSSCQPPNHGADEYGSTIVVSGMPCRRALLNT